MRPLALLLSASLGILPLSACGDKGGGGGGGVDGTDGGGDDGDDGGDGGDGNTTWRPSGYGVAWMADGTEGNSLFHLEIETPALPREGEAYYGYLFNADGSSLGLGEIAIDNTTQVVFEYDVGRNLLVDGYDRFAAYMGTSGDANTSGELVWEGQIDPTLREAYEQLLLADPATPDGSGSARHLKDTVIGLIEFSQETLDSTSDVAVLNTRGESVANTIRGAEEDLDGDDLVSRIEDFNAILSETGTIELILEDLATASLSVDPGHPVKDLANYAYDCTQRVEEFATEAARQAGRSSSCNDLADCQENVAQSIQNLEWARDGQDDNGDTEIDPITEGGVDCAIEFANQMAFMEIALATGE